MRLGGEEDVGGCIMRSATCKVKEEGKKKGKRTFDIAMNDPVFVKKREGQQDFTDDEADVQFF